MIHGVVTVGTAAPQFPSGISSHLLLGVVLIGVAFVSGRLLGIRVSWLKALGAGLRHDRVEVNELAA